MKSHGLWLLWGCFFLSGVAGLIYETAWTQELALIFGTSELALVTVLAAYMGGLALGAWLAGRWVRRLRRPILTYGVLELGIALAALLVPVAITGVGRLHAALLGGAELPAHDASWATAVFYSVSSFSILLVPTALMGATLPLLARHAVRREAEIGFGVGFLYAANTVGAAAGALGTAFLLLPRMGLGATIGVAAAVNVVVFFAALLLARRAPPLDADEAHPSPSKPSLSWTVPWVLPAVLVSGAVSFSWEILWTRLLTPLLGGSVYAFATMLASFLVALGLGSALAARLASNSERSHRGFALAQVLIAALSLSAFAAVDYLPHWMGQGSDPAGTTAGAALAGTVLAGNMKSASLLSAVFLLPGALAMGATFPFAVRILARRAEEAALASARVFAWNTVGAILGALATGYFLLPALRFAGTAAAASAVSLSLAVFTTLGLRPRRPVLGTMAVTGLLVLLAAPPSTPWGILRYFPMSARQAPGEVVHYGVGRSATVLLLAHQGEWRLTTNGLPESSIESPEFRPGRHVVARWLSLLPVALRPMTSSLLAVGLGAGVTVEDLPPSVETLYLVELEPEVIRANRRVADLRRQDPLADPRLSLHVNDARGALRLTRRRFDAIVSQPSHPWTSGAANLYTREFFALVRERLEPGGVFVQWMGLHFVDESLLRSLVATAVHVFPYVEVYQPRPGAVLVVGSAQPLDLAATAPRALGLAHGQWRELGVLCREDLLAARVLDTAGARRFARNASLVTDSRNLLRMRSPGALGHPLLPSQAADLLAPFDVLSNLPEDVDRPYLVRRLIRQGAVRRARRLAETLPHPGTRQAAFALVELAAGRRRLAHRALERARQLDPKSGEVLAARLVLYRNSITSGDPMAPAPEVDPQHATVVEGWRLTVAGDGSGTRRLDARLAALGPKDPLYATATRLRVRWRIESGDPALAQEAMDLLLPLLSPVPGPQDLLLRARAGAVSGEPRVALAAVAEALQRLRGPGPKGELMREAGRILERLPVTEATAGWQRGLLQQLERSSL